jgi:hypothetical protein
LSLPFPGNRKGIQSTLETIDERLLSCSELFIKQQVKTPLLALLTRQITSFSLSTTQSDWFNVYSIYSSNQQLNEACNKLWATMELAYATGKDVWKRQYQPIGESFDGRFLLGTLIPNLYYAAMSASVSILSTYGCVPVLVNRKHLFLVRTSIGWIVSERQNYMRDNFGFGAKSWHDQILKTYVGLRDNGIKLPLIDMDNIFELKSLRNSMQYEILGDLRMWRMFKDKKAYFKFLPKVIHLIGLSIELLRSTARITTDCDTRFENLIANYRLRS